MLDIKINVKGHSSLFFDKKELKSAIRKGGTEVQREARRLISSRAVSGAGDLPGYDTGAMSRSVKTKVGSGGLYAIVSPHKTPEMGNDYYPAYLIHGTSRGIEKRKDFIISALQNKQFAIRLAMRMSLVKSIRAIGAL